MMPLLVFFPHLPALVLASSAAIFSGKGWVVRAHFEGLVIPDWHIPPIVVSNEFLTNLWHEYETQAESYQTDMDGLEISERFLF